MRNMKSQRVNPDRMIPVQHVRKMDVQKARRDEKLKRLLLFLIRFYRKYLSPLKTRYHCIYVPTCSEYALEAIEKRGAFAGSFLALLRILRCNPLFRGGYDPVPERGFRDPSRVLRERKKHSPTKEKGI